MVGSQNFRGVWGVAAGGHGAAAGAVASGGHGAAAGASGVAHKLLAPQRVAT